MEGSVGIVGYGFVGQAVYGSVREEHLGRVRVYDKYKKIHTAKDVLRCPIVYCCLPTVDGGTGEQDFSAYRDFFSLAIEEKYNGVLVVKSTVLYENLEPYLDKLNIVMNPEFLNQNNAIEDFRNQKVVILGGRIDHCRKVARCYFENFMMNENCEVEFCSVKEAVEIKYMHNIYHAYKVLFWNYVQEQTGNSRKISELYHKITERNELSRVCADGKKGYGGACLVSGTKILTKKGIKNIEEVVVGDLVWDGEKYTRVTKSGSRKVSKTIEIDSRGRKIRGSLDHIHLVWSQFDSYEKCEGFLEEKLLKDVSVDDWVFVLILIKTWGKCGGV
jgi:hypothetical protein